MICLSHARHGTESCTWTISVFPQNSPTDCPFTGEGVRQNLENGFRSKTRSQSQDPSSNALSLINLQTASLLGLTVILCKLQQLREGGAQKCVCCCQKDTNLDSTVKEGSAAGVASQEDVVQSTSFSQMSVTLMPACESVSPGLPFTGSCAGRSGGHKGQRTNQSVDFQRHKVLLQSSLILEHFSIQQ